jgi:hypothetical protein
MRHAATIRGRRPLKRQALGGTIATVLSSKGYGMTQEALSATAGLLKDDVAFVYAFFQAAELEARQTERYVLVTLGGMYSYFATKEIPDRLRRLAWYSPVLIVVFAAIRALGLMLRQEQLLNYLKHVEQHFPYTADAPGWANWYARQPSVVALPTVLFYLLLFAITLFIARRMARNVDRPTRAASADLKAPLSGR